MQQTLTIKWSNTEITFSDLDQDNDIEIDISENFGDDSISMYITKENIISLKKHLDYIIAKF